VAASQNGWRANDPTVVSRRQVPGTQIWLTVHNGPAGDLLLEVASRFDRDVRDIDNARGALDDWGYAERPIRGGVELSNHASGTAIDLNATKWPLSSDPSVNLNSGQIMRVRQIVAAAGGVVRWGGDYTGRKDPMHFEINDGRTEADCARALAALRGSGGGGGAGGGSHATIQRGSTGRDVELLQRFLGVVGPGDAGYGTFGPATEKAARRYQQMQGLTVDGVVGPATWSRIERGL
jgi:hypothetical protein